MKAININGRIISPSHPPYIVAEISANHNGSIARAKEIISSASYCGADAVKLQTYTPDTLTLDCNNDDFLISGGLWDGKRLYDLYGEAYTPFEWHKPLFDHARSENITCFSSPFDKSAVDLLEDLNAPAYKIASFETIDLPLIKYVAETKKPMIISTGMANFQEIEEAVNCARDNGCEQLILLHCISSYPAPISDSNLATISDLSKQFDVVPGLSDHSMGTVVSTAAVAMGACFVEKHFTESRKDIGPDSSFSLEPKELQELCLNSKLAWESIGRVGYSTKQSEMANTQFRRSLYFVKSVKLGDIIQDSDVRSIRPGYGLEPKYIDKVIGSKMLKPAEKGDRVTGSHFECDLL